MSQTDQARGFHRVVVKLYAPEPPGITDDAAAFVPVFHEWIRKGALDLVMIDVADYAHAPDSPGIMLVTHEISFALDRSDGRFGLLAQRRTPVEGGAIEAIEGTVRHTLRVAELLEAEPSLAGQLQFDRSRIRVESNDRLRAPNTQLGFDTFAPVVLAALESILPGGQQQAVRVENDPRDRLALEVRLAVPKLSGESIAA
jgi:hypothetical protein